MNDRDRWQKPDANGRSRADVLRARHVIKRALRDYLHGEGFIEIDAPLLVRGTTPDAEIESFHVGDHALVTSTEYQIKRLEAGGFDRLYTLTQNFRAGDEGRYNAREFTMLEWARVGGDLAQIEDDLENMIRAAAQGRDRIDYLGHELDIAAPFARRRVINVLETASGLSGLDFSADAMRTVIAALGVNIARVDDAAFLFSVAMDEAQKKLGFDRPVFVRDWPDFHASSAPAAKDGLVERSELYIAGIEISNGFPTLTDAAAQRRSFDRQQALRRAAGRKEASVDHAYLDAMDKGLPPGAGMAMGVDRLVMVLTGQDRIKNVLAFAADEL
jgi:lysyl-tRNA synthetase class 2